MASGLVHPTLAPFKSAPVFIHGVSESKRTLGEADFSKYLSVLIREAREGMPRGQVGLGDVSVSVRYMGSTQ